MTIYQDRHGTVSIDGHRAYIEAIEQQDARLEATMTEIRRRHDSGELYGAASAIERAEALEAHLQRCQELRRTYLGGN